MSWLPVVVGLALLLWPLVVSIRRGTELFVLRVKDGRVKFVRGRMPQGLLNELVDVLGTADVRRVELRVVRRGGRPELLVRGELDGDRRQRVRNVLGQYSVARIAAGGPPGRSSKRG